MRPGTTFASVASPPKEGESVGSEQPKAATEEGGQGGAWVMVANRRNRQSSPLDSLSSPKTEGSLAGSKRQRLPPTCGHCLRSTHRTSECRHLLMCKRCGGVGHMAFGCRVELPSPPRRRRARPPAKARCSDLGNRSVAPPVNSDRTAVDRLHPQKINISLSLTQVTVRLRKDLAKIIVLDVISG